VCAQHEQVTHSRKHW